MSAVLRAKPSTRVFLEQLGHDVLELLRVPCRVAPGGEQMCFVLDVSEEHRGHQSFQENVESHFEIVIVSKIFNNKSKIDRHRMVNQTLKEEYLSDLHSVTIRALTVEEFS